MNSFLEPPHPALNLNGKIIKFKYSKPDNCEVPHLRLARIVSSSDDHEEFVVEQIQPVHGIRKLKRNRIICFQVVDSDLTAMNSGPNDGPKNPFLPE